MPNPFVALIASHQVPLMEPTGAAHKPWRIWINYNREKTAGTYLNLFADGTITRETLLPTGEVVNSAFIKRK